MSNFGGGKLDETVGRRFCILSPDIFIVAARNRAESSLLLSVYYYERFHAEADPYAVRANCFIVPVGECACR